MDEKYFLYIFDTTAPCLLNIYHLAERILAGANHTKIRIPDSGEAKTMSRSHQSVSGAEQQESAPTDQ